jgi:hypothetical protein
VVFANESLNDEQRRKALRRVVGLSGGTCQYVFKVM